ncbi:T9SS type A sorting domain-containing protein [Paracrocinitomix mangrovi]|uniref:T9SS type A sorting domain-containing protein n=1 Tax=Paracrocinitomix mangrovi TaxID=2862509 RepID=UPI001C8DF51B|nr:T9SS type A sorting domain-containing protein [Paracrocinitomix mangrovi]UKN00736.1 T9SS type A sorting domain-containing protein [Paracrocinitomix mangrovi]
MKRLLLVLIVLLASFSYGQQYGNSYKPETNPQQFKAAGCAPANASTFLEFNNVKALIHTGGNLWQISGQNFSQYEVPKGSGIMALFTSALWLGGVDINGQLKIAAVRYRDGNDYWAGPLTDGGDAEIIPSECAKYDQHYVVTQDEVRQFDAWYKAGIKDQQEGTNTQSELFPDYEIPVSILDWPAHGDLSLGQNYYLAPFYDRNQDGNYDPLQGDYPWYDIEKELDCSVDRTVTLYGDQTVWWVMNDKGNIHTETGADPLGMEIRCQAFAFATNDEVNNMTFYNYELVNRSTQTLYGTYFGVFIDGALGGPNDDYVGCDVSRGLGYTYNGDAFDETMGGFKGYGVNPPAAGVDFFEGPYQDNDGIDNPLTTNYNQAITQNGIPYKGLGIGYGDGIVDNERMGMRRFLYYNNLGGGALAAQTDPQTGQDYYNYLSGYWKDGTPFVYGGSGHPASAGAIPAITSNYMFPGESDSLGWGTSGIPQQNWTEQTAGNVPYDRRFAQSSGPFVLQPGAVNNITYGICWARATSGDPFESVKELRKADDKAQALFDNCFKVLDGPHAPELSIQEMENELIVSIYNEPASNNKDEDYSEFDPFLVNVDNDPNFDGNYKFQGYQVYQIKDETVSPTDLDNVELARLVFQCDVKDSITKLVNYEFDPDIGATVPQVMVDGENEGIRHSFSVKEDQFATGSRELVNFKRYYFMAVSYAVNQFKEYDPNDPGGLDGQKIPYLASRKAAIGEIRAFEGIPHPPEVESGGTTFNGSYGYEIPLTKIDGWGNGGIWTELSEDSEDAILTNGSQNEITYKPGASPVRIQIIDPLNVPNSDFEFFFVEDTGGGLDEAGWFMHNLTTGDTVWSDKSIDIPREQLIPEWGLSVWIEQTSYVGTGLISQIYTSPIGATMVFADSAKQWLTGVQDNDNYFPSNWIRSGIFNPNDPDPCQWGTPSIFTDCAYPDYGDDLEEYEGLLDGIVAPFKLTGKDFLNMPIGYPDADLSNYSGSNNGWFGLMQTAQSKSAFPFLHGVDLVITSDQTKWTRCAVIENNWNNNQTIGDATVMELRQSPSKDINGDEITGEVGMSYFPGYAIDIETGERLNLAFAENSWLNGSNGTDMLWNPTNEYVDNVGNPIFGGGHYIYIFGNSIEDDNTMPAYDNGDYMQTMLQNEISQDYYKVWKNCMWVLSPMLEDNHTLLETDVRIQLRVSHPYQQKTFTGVNNGNPAYRFNTNELYTSTQITNQQIDKLDLIKIVPNPYYGYSEYENGQLDNRIKITNLPENCTITIWNISGQLVKTITKDNPSTFQDWNMKNDQGIPIASGLYIFHIDVPGVGERILKWYGMIRVVDTQNF